MNNYYADPRADAALAALHAMPVTANNTMAILQLLADRLVSLSVREYQPWAEDASTLITDEVLPRIRCDIEEQERSAEPEELPPRPITLGADELANGSTKLFAKS